MIYRGAHNQHEGGAPKLFCCINWLTVCGRYHLQNQSKDYVRESCDTPVDNTAPQLPQT